MIIYILVFILLYLANFTKHKNMYSAIIIFALISIRYNVGADFSNYYNLGKLSYLKQYGIFNLSQSHFLDALSYQYYRFEILNRIVYQIVWRVNCDPQLGIAIYSFIMVVFLVISFKYYKIKTNISWVLFYSMPVFMFYYLSIVRQGCAVTLCLLSYRFIKEKRFFYFCSVILIASFFHKSALIFLIAYFVSNFRFNFLNGIVLFLVGLYFENVMVIILSLSKKYNHYLNGQYIQSGTKFLYIVILLYSLLIFICHKYKSIYQKNIIEINIFLIGCFFYIILRKQGLTGARISSYFLIYLLFIGEKLVTICKQKKMCYQVISLFCILILCISLYIDALKGKNSQFIPYRIFINNKVEEI